MSFWKADCTKIQRSATGAASAELDTSMDGFGSSGHWSAPCGGGGGTTATDQQPLLMQDGAERGFSSGIRHGRLPVGAELFIDEGEQSVDFSLPQPARKAHPPGLEQLPSQLPSFSAYLSSATAAPAASGQASVQGGWQNALPPAGGVRLPYVSPPASPQHSEETVGCAPHRVIAMAPRAAKPVAPHDPADISGVWCSSKRRRLAGASEAESQGTHASRCLELADDAESGLAPPPAQPAWRLPVNQVDSDDRRFRAWAAASCGVFLTQLQPPPQLTCSVSYPPPHQLDAEE